MSEIVSNINLLDLPQELLIYILKFLNNRSVKRLALVNTYFFELTKENSLMEINIFENKDFAKLPSNLSFIKHCRKITTLIDINPICKFYLQGYQKLYYNSIKKLIVTSCSCGLGRSEVIQLLESNKNMTDLSLKINFNLLELNYFDTIIDLKRLKYLSLSNSNISDMGLKDCLEQLPHLEGLKIIHFPNLYLFNLYIPTLKEISINRCNNIDNEFLGIFIKSHPLLEKIDFSNMSIGISSSLLLARYAKKITHLNLSYSDNIINDLDLALICSYFKLFFL